MPQRIETVIVGGGQAGLSTSYYLKQLGREHIVLEQAAQAGHAWRSDRWDSFTLVTPNWMTKLPGMEYHGDQPDGFMLRDEVVAYFEQYASALPVEYGVTVTAVEPVERGFRVTTDQTIYEADNVVMATGLYQSPRLPAFSAELPGDILQVASGQYRNPQALPDGAVLVVGTAQSGCQIAEELYQSGRQVYLAVSSTGRAPRRYRGKDVFAWLEMIRFLDRTPDKLPSPKGKFAPNPYVSGKDGGHSLNLHQFARDGVRLLGRVQGASDGKIRLAPDLHESLTKADQFEAMLTRMIDDCITPNGLDSPAEQLPQLKDGYDVPLVEELDLKAAGISAIIWATGYRFDFSLVKLPIFDEDGYPIQKRGVTDHRGLYFMGLPWLYKQKSGLMIGVGEDAAYIASAIGGQAT
jgi:putative flavoprotein involved in K+ transport